MNTNRHHVPPEGGLSTERRSGRNRRDRTSIFPLSYLGPLRRKRGGRRKGDVGYVDIYDMRTWGMAVSVIIMSLLDAALTHQHLATGMAFEANPIMRAVIDAGGMPAFYLVKAFLTLAAIGIIMLHEEWKFGRYAARFCLWAYIFLSIYHLFVINVIHRSFG